MKRTITEKEGEKGEEEESIKKAKIDIEEKGEDEIEQEPEDEGENEGDLIPKLTSSTPLARKTSRKNLSIGIWRNDLKMTEVNTVRGSWQKSMGRHYNGKIYLLPEESLYLLDKGLLEVTYNGYPVSVQYGFCLFLGSHFPLHYYQVYSELRRMGYVLCRHSLGFSSWPFNHSALTQSTPFTTSSSSTSPSSINPKTTRSNSSNNSIDSNQTMTNNQVENNPDVNINSLYTKTETNSVVSLLKQKVYYSYDEIYSELRIIRTIPRPLPSPAKEAENLNNKGTTLNKNGIDVIDLPDQKLYEIFYDVFQNSATFSKKNSESALNFRLVIARYSDRFPSDDEIQCLLYQANGVLLKMAVVDFGTISFFGFPNFDTPTLQNDFVPNNFAPKSNQRK